MMPSQDKCFSSSEADNWFHRNRSALDVDRLQAHDPLMQVLAGAGVRPTRCLEIGAANGYRLEALRRAYGCQATAVEPSAAAVADGRARFAEIEFVEGLAHELDGLAMGGFDLVISSFVLHWVDRERLLATAAAIDRVLADGGHLLIADFLPEHPVKVRYHHRLDAEIWTYKQDYAELWLASHLYRKLDRRVGHHSTKEFADGIPPEHRFAVTLLRKEICNAYPTAELPL